MVGMVGLVGGDWKDGRTLLELLSAYCREYGRRGEGVLEGSLLEAKDSYLTMFSFASAPLRTTSEMEFRSRES